MYSMVRSHKSKTRTYKIKYKKNVLVWRIQSVVLCSSRKCDEASLHYDAVVFGDDGLSWDEWNVDDDASSVALDLVFAGETFSDEETFDGGFDLGRRVEIRWEDDVESKSGGERNGWINFRMRVIRSETHLCDSIFAVIPAPGNNRRLGHSALAA